jgi:DNA modification methylase
MRVRPQPSASPPPPATPNLIGDNHKLVIGYVATELLTLDPNDPQFFSAADRKRLKRIVRQSGIRLPIVVNASHRVIIGQNLLIGARANGIAEVPVIFITDVSGPELDAMALAYANLGKAGGWDKAKLRAMFLRLEIELPDLDFVDLGFEVAVIDMTIAGGDEQEVEEERVAAGPFVSRAGDLYRCGCHRLLVGDATVEAHVARLMNGYLAAAMFTDPPYNLKIDGFVSGAGRRKHREFAMGVGEMSKTEFTGFLGKFIALASRFSRGGAVHFICMDWRHMAELLEAGATYYGALLNMCVWVKDRAGMGSMWRSRHELVFAYRVGRERQRNNVMLGKYGRNRTNVWEFPSAATFMAREEGGDLLKDHPTPKPVAMVAEAILDCTARGDVVLDPFLGTGTTLIAAEKTGRTCHGIELEPEYVDLIVRRWQAWTGEDAIHDETGMTFNALGTHRAEEVAHD